jgi:hypothetical protein
MDRRDAYSRGSEGDTPTPEDQNQVLRNLQGSFALWAMGIEIMRATVDDWAKRRHEHLQAAMKTLNAAAQLPSEEEKATEFGKVFRQQLEHIFEDWSAASVRAMNYGGAAVRQFQEGMRGSPFAPGMPPAPDADEPSSAVPRSEPEDHARR